MLEVFSNKKYIAVLSQRKVRSLADHIVFRVIFHFQEFEMPCRFSIVVYSLNLVVSVASDCEVCTANLRNIHFDYFSLY